MDKILANLKNPHFKAKGWYLVFLPLSLLSWKKKQAIQKFAHKHWYRNPTIMHRLKWTCS